MARRGAGGPPQQRGSPRPGGGASPSRRARNRSIAALALLVAIAAPAAAQRHAPAPPLGRWPGCYRLEVGAWSSGVDSSYAPPAALRLTTLAATAPPTRRGPWYAVEGEMPAFAARRSLLAVVGWRPSSGDSATVVWGDGFVRLTATLALQGDSIAGALRWHRVTPRLDPDGRPLREPDRRATLRGARVPCPG